jgi:hypothetical protein
MSCRRIPHHLPSPRRVECERDTNVLPCPLRDHTGIPLVPFDAGAQMWKGAEESINFRMDLGWGHSQLMGGHQ